MTTEIDELEILEDEIKKDSKKEKKPLADKSMDELVHMNEEAQKQISRQGNEIGELRNLTDEILRKQLQDKEPKKKEPEADWEYNPKEAAEQLVNSKVDAIEAKLEEQQRQSALESFEGKHPDYKTTSVSTAFRDWIMQSAYRVRMYEQGNAGDFTAADDLFTEWSRVKPKEDDNSDSDREQKLRDAKMEKGGGQGNTKKIFRRADIRNLRLRDPMAYEARAEEFHLAYQEGRVR